MNEETVRELTDEEKLKKIEEALRAIKREVHVREWDKGKEIPGKFLLSPINCPRLV